MPYDILERRGGRLKREGFQAKEETVRCGNRQCGQVKKEAGVGVMSGLLHRVEQLEKKVANLQETLLLGLL